MRRANPARVLATFLGGCAAVLVGCAGSADPEVSGEADLVEATRARTVPDKYVGMFYATWFNGTEFCGDQASACPPTFPEEVPQWTYRYWGNPQGGKYLSTDIDRIHRHADQMAAAGVDFIVVDYSNNNITQPNLDAGLGPLLDTYQARYQQGRPTPKIVVFMPAIAAQIATLHASYYANHDSHIFFRYQGKPLLLYRADQSGSCPGNACSHFTTRGMWGLMGHGNSWSFMEHSPQSFYSSGGRAEQISVAPAQQTNWMSNIHGNPPPHGRAWNKHTGANDGWYGQNFWDQWGRAISVNPRFIVVRGWNEWAALKTGLDSQGGFTDEYNQEYSNDIEPMSGGHGDYFVELLARRVADWKFGGNVVALATSGGQSSTHAGAGWQRAIDGNRSGDWGDGSVTHTEHDERASWWVDLGTSQALGQVKIWNRSDCCANRLSSFRVRLDDGAGRTTTIRFPGQAGSPTVLDFNGSRAKRVTIQLDGTNQLSLAEVEAYTSHVDQAPVHGKSFQVHAKHSDRCLDMPDGTTTSIAHQWTCHGGDNQIVKLVDRGGGWWQLRFRHSGLCLDQKGHPGNGRLQQWPCIDNPNQRFRFEDAGGGYWFLRSQTSGRVLDVNGGTGATGDGPHFYQWDWNGNDNQKFKLVPVP